MVVATQARGPAPHPAVNEDNYPGWKRAFAPQTRTAQIDEDLFAARTVAAVLIAIVTMGTLLGLFGVLMAV